jgi:NAD-dependent SIR2 family protein deacetylase
MLLDRLSGDGDILGGREDLHPDWIKVYESKQRTLIGQTPPEVLKQIAEFFKASASLDKELYTLDLRKIQTTFLLGAGASKPKPSDIPTVKELLPQLLERGRRLDREDVTKLADFCKERGIDNIEDLLTAAQLATFSSRNPTILGLLNYLLYGGDADGSGGEIYSSPERYQSGRFARRRETAAANVSSVAFLQDTLQVLFGLLASTMLPAKPNKAHEAIAAFSKAHAHSVIVTTNYDCCMDLALEEVKLPLTYCLEFANMQKKTAEGISDEVRLIKLHGSLNWYYCETCQMVQCVDIRNTVQGYLQDKAPYSVIAICKDCGGQRRGLLVPPLAMKFDVAPPLTPLLTEARGAFESAGAIVVVGFSFAEADVYISRMLSKSMQSKPDQKLIILDPDTEVVSRVKRKFMSSIPNFIEERIIGITDDCSDALPKLLNGEYLKEAEQTSPATKRRGRIVELEPI